MKQRKNECLLASVCHLTDNDYLTASDLYREMHGGASWYDTLPMTQAELTPDHPNRAFLTYLAGYDIFGEMSKNRNRIVHLERDKVCDMVSHGTGIVIVTIPKGRHATMFSDGLIYDSANDTVYLAEQYLDMIWDFRGYVDTVYLRPKGGDPREAAMTEDTSPERCEIQNNDPSPVVQG